MFGIGGLSRAEKNYRFKKKAWKWFRTGIIIGIILFILWLLLQLWADYQIKLAIIQNYMDVNNHNIQVIQDNVANLQQSVEGLRVKINGLDQHIVTQDGIIYKLNEAKNQLKDISNSIPQIDVPAPAKNPSIIENVGNAAGIFTVVVGGLELVRRAVMFLPLIP